MQIKAERDHLLMNEASASIGKRSLGTHRFQRAVVARCAIKSNGSPSRDCTLEAMRTQARANYNVNCNGLLFAQASVNQVE
jgi:hypothetical protein